MAALVGRFGKVWEGLGRFGKVWEGLGRFGSFWVHCRPLQRYCVWRLSDRSDGSDKSDGYCSQAVAIVCVVGRTLPGVSLAGAERLPAAAGFARFSILLKPSQIFPILSRGTSGFVALRRDKQVFALRRYSVCRYLRLPLITVYLSCGLVGGVTVILKRKKSALFFNNALFIRLVVSDY